MFAFVGLDNKPITEFVQMRTETCPEAKEDWERIVWSSKTWNIVLYTCVSAENVKPYKCGGACWAWRNKSPTWISIRNTFLSLKFNCTENHPLTAPFFFTIDLDSSFIIIQISFNKFCAVLRCQISLLELKKSREPDQHWEPSNRKYFSGEKSDPCDVPPKSSEMKNEWQITSSPPYVP